MKKGICATCGEVVVCTELTFTKESGIVASKDDGSTPFVLCVTHKAKEGCKTSGVVSETTGKVLETHCDGTLRPPKSLVH